MTKNRKKKLQLKFFIYFFWSKTAIYLSLGLHKVCPSYRRSLQLSKEAIQHFKTWFFTNFFLPLWVIFCPPGSGSTDPIESGSNPIRIRNPGVKRCGLRYIYSIYFRVVPASISGKESVHDMSTEVHTESNTGKRGRFDIYDIVETS